jgi:glutathione S-transferase
VSEKLIIHHLVKSCSERIVWLAEELGIEYELIVHHRDPETLRAPDVMKNLSPFGKSPVIQHGDIVVSESAAIIEYMLDVYDKDNKFRPKPGTREYLDYRFMMFASEATMKTPLLCEIINSMTGTEPSPALKTFLSLENLPVYDYLSKALAKTDYLVGDFSGADLMAWFVLRIAGNVNMPGKVSTSIPLTNYPSIIAYMERMEARPACKKAQQLCNVEPA